MMSVSNTMPISQPFTPARKSVAGSHSGWTDSLYRRRPRRNRAGCLTGLLGCGDQLHTWPRAAASRICCGVMPVMPATGLTSASVGSMPQDAVGDDHELVGGIPTFHVKTRVSLRDAVRSWAWRKAFS